MNFSQSKPNGVDASAFANQEDDGGKSHDDAGSEGGEKDKGLNDLDFQDRNGQHHPIAEFLYQLTKMLTDDNTEIIEWADGRIKVHHPERLEAEVLHKYFRHSKFASFQRQLNYFGFRKIAGKGKMSPCSYVNEGATSDIRSLLLIKRKTNGSAARKAMQQRAAAAAVMTNPMNPLLAGMNLSALTGAAAAQGLGGMNGQALSNAIALLSENALRAGLPALQGNQQNSISQTQLSLLALQQQQQQLQQQLQQQQKQQQFAQGNSHDQLLQLSQQQFQQQQNQFQAASAPMSQGGMPAPGPAALKSPSQRTPSLEQLHAQLAANLAATQQQQNHNQQQLNLAGLSGLTSMPATAALKNAGSMMDNPATAALQAQNGSMPATAAMDAASASAQASNNLFESAINLKSLLQEHQQNLEANRNQVQMNNANQALLNRLPSSAAIFPESMSTVSLGNLLGSSNRLNSLLSLSSFSREASLADFAAMNNIAQLHAASGSMHPGDPSRIRSNP
jgi:hypothetical protein